MYLTIKLKKKWLNSTSNGFKESSKKKVLKRHKHVWIMGSILNKNLVIIDGIPTIVSLKYTTLIVWHPN